MRAFLDHVSLSVEEEQSLRLHRKLLDEKAARPAPSSSRNPCGGGGRGGGGGGRGGGQWGGKDGRAARAAEAAAEAATRDAVFLGTVHQAKGLEWKTVFVVSE